jgi:long-chain acyl-CoA synthetase
MNEHIDGVVEANPVIAKATNLYEAYITRARYEPQSVVIHQALIGELPREWKPITYAQMSEQIAKLMVFLVENGVGNGSACAICSNTCPEWLVSDVAILGLGGVTVAVYTTLPTHDIAYILKDSGSQIVIVENQALVEKVLNIHTGYTDARGAELPAYPLKRIVCINPCKPHPLVTSFSEILSSDSAPLPAFSATNRESLASLVYTSGSTGTPKGVMQSHGNHLANIEQVTTSEVFGPGGTIFLYLPLAHSFARLVGYLGLFTSTALKMPAITDPISGTLDVASVSQDMRAANCEYIPSIPRLFEKAKMSIERKASEKNLKAWFLRQTLLAAREMFRCNTQTVHPSTFNWFVYHVTESLRQKLKEAIFGNNFKHSISGGAKLSPDVVEFFESIGVKILQGYGLTETCVATNVNPPHNNRIGTVGPTFEGIEIKITSEGEICFKGENVTKGYWNRPEDTAVAWDDAGWFHTGDLGTLDNHGYLTITGRKKEVIVSAGGKKIPPQKIEKLLETISDISYAILFGNDRPFCVALLVPNFTLSAGQSSNVQDHPEIWKKIEQINEQLAPFEKVRRARFVRDEFTTENGLLTPTQKIKRNEIRDKYQDLIWEMYDFVPHPNKVIPS